MNIISSSPSPSLFNPIQVSDHGECKIKEIINIFLDCLTKKNPAAVMAKSESGGTGFTFLCKVPMGEISKPRGLVLKWQSSALCQVEKIGSDFYRLLGFSAPHISLVQEKLNLRLISHAIKRYPSLESKKSQYALIAMKEFHANTFSSAIKNGKFQSLSCDDQNTVAKTLGSLSAADLFFANDDRILSFTPTTKNHFKETSGFNSGNLMLEIEGGTPEIPDGQLKNVHAIDNCSSSLLMDCEVNMIEEDFGLGIFDDMEIASECALSDKTPITQKTSPDEYVESYHTLFKNLYDRVDVLAKHAQENMRNEIKSVMIDPENCRQFVQRFSTHFESGYRETMEKIKNLKTRALLSLSLGKENLDKFAGRVLELVIKNHKFLKNNQ